MAAKADLNFTIPGYCLMEQVYSGSQTVVYRAVTEKVTSECEPRSVVIKILHQDYPSFKELLQFRNQYAIAKNLDIPGIVHPYSLEACGNSYALVMEDFGGMSLRDYARSVALSVPEVLEIALQVANILHALHHHRVIHKDIKPANILIHPESKQIKLIDFSIASLLPKETQEIKNPNGLEGTLAYLAPEQTGRMNRGIDYRADFYALGVTLFELLTGQLPFQSNDPMELVHCHIAKQPPSLSKFNLPSAIASIVIKLMAKNAEDRYQSALGLKYDLQTCLEQWQETGSIEPFEIGKRDLCDRFLIPEKLYGRETEVQTLLNAFDRVANGTSELMLVAGFSGIGKTAVVNEVHKPIVRQRGYFIKGKFDQFNRNIPFSAFVQAFRDLMAQLFSESDLQLQTWKTKILEALGENAQVLIDVIPELERIIGVQPPATELSGTAAQNRFNLLFQKFIQVFTTAEHPLVMFLDDLQWADLASLKLMPLLIGESPAGYLLVIGAYRDNEVFAAHPLMLTLEEVVKAGAIVNTITLKPLSESSLNQLVADTLTSATVLAQPLTELVYQKTQGNPFFATQFLKAIYQNGWITFEAEMGHWQCNLTQVRAAALTNDVVEFMSQQLQKLPTTTQEVLKLAACIGNQFDLTTLAIVSEKEETETATALWKALQEGLVLPESDIYKFYLGSEHTISQGNHQTVSYRFLHDRVQQAAYFLIPEEQKKVTHYRIGQRLLKNTSQINREERIFEIVNQINIAVELIEPATEREEVAKLNLIAGCKAKNSTAYNAAVKYFTVGRNLLASNRWLSQYDLTLALYVEATEAAYLNTDIDEMVSLAEEVLHQAKTALDTVKVYAVRINAYTSQGQLLEAINTGLTALKQFEIDLPASPEIEDVARVSQETQVLLDSRKPADLLNLPEMINPQMLAALQILDVISIPAYLAKPNLNSLVIMTQMKLSMTYGNAPSSALAYSSYGLFLCAVAGEIERGYEFSQLALNLLVKLKAKKIEARVLFVTTTFIVHWKVHGRDTLKLLQNAYSSGWESGSLMDLGYAAYAYGFHAYLTGYELPQLEQEMTAYSKVLGQINQQTQLNYNELYREMVLNLLGHRTNPSCLLGEIEKELALLARYQLANDKTGLWHFFFIKVMLCYLFQEFEKTLEYIEQAKHYSSGGKGMFNIPTFYFYVSLTQLAIYSNHQKSEQETILQQVTANQKNMQRWATYAPMNHLHKFHLVEAEKHRVLDEKMAAIELYDSAIADAKENGFIQDEALANELAAKFYLDWGKEKVAAGYMQEAYYCYAHWGAKAKTDDLENRYPNLLRPILQQATQTINPFETLASISAPNYSIHSYTTASSSSSTSINTALDFGAILKASQILSSTIQIEDLLHQLTQVILQNSGGDRCALILPNSQGQWQMQAIATPEETQLCSVPLDCNLDLPVKLIQYVKNTREVVVIEDMKTNLPILDEYLIQRKPKSILCLPILNQGKLLGILYLKNRTTSGVFTNDRILILNFLCTQAAISLENARIYQESQTYAQQLEQSLEKLRVSETRFQKLADNVPGLIYQIRIKADGSASMPYVSSGCQTLYEVAAEDMMTGKYSLRDFEYPDDRVEVFQAVMESAQNLTPFRHEWRIITPNGNLKWVKAASQPERWEDGEIVWDGMLIDITDRKCAEAAVLQKSQELEQALVELQNAQLQMVQNEKMASLGNLVAGVAHEINNPMGFLNGSINNAKDYVQYLLEHLGLYQEHYPLPVAPIQENAEDIELEFLTEDLPKLLNSMRGATDRIKGISTSLRIFSRADTDRKVSANLHEGIDSTLLILKYRLKANENRPAIAAIQDYGELPPVECFPGQLNQVFMNILANAIDMFDEMAKTRSFDELTANPQQITIRTEAIANQVLVRIEDNGKGMSEALQAQIFDHLFTTKGVGKGTGLGLTIARQIVVEKHGGAIEVASTLGQGTAFTIHLPVKG
ncbi:AAA family ATPase [Kamptonema sp. UHCC 0994]|uniref:ATP-binding sensor histidine kinase n=1 Tax=Kamptonema sp. UHCC 0994 TaxID=3031329 RepID=UPI0023BA48FF|nr:AAA family ATPase [Kamptonema sp. UHCC 0994]MDF0556902.1 AAA family ATPase [Kamptonema sp. UHCC 0994]